MFLNIAFSVKEKTLFPNDVLSDCPSLYPFKKWLCSIVMFVYQRVTAVGHDCHETSQLLK